MTGNVPQRREVHTAQHQYGQSHPGAGAAVQNTDISGQKSPIDIEHAEHLARQQCAQQQTEAAGDQEKDGMVRKVRISGFDGAADHFPLDEEHK
ncbi:hypothetical protein D3C71_1478940 [compost metagenome]